MFERIDQALQALEIGDKDCMIEHCEDVQSTALGEQRLPMSGITFVNVMQANIFFHVNDCVWNLAERWCTSWKGGLFDVVRCMTGCNLHAAI